MTSFYLKSYKLSSVIVIILAIGLCFFDYRVALGLLIGFIADYIYNVMMANSLTEILSGDNRNKVMITLKIMFNLIIIALPLLISFIWPTMFHFIGAFIGLVINKLCFVIVNIRG